MRICSKIGSMQLGFKMIKSCQLEKIFDKDETCFFLEFWLFLKFRKKKSNSKIGFCLPWHRPSIFTISKFWKIQTLFEAWKRLILMKIDIGSNLNKLSKLLQNRLSQIEILLRPKIRLTRVSSLWNKTKFQSAVMINKPMFLHCNDMSNDDTNHLIVLIT